MTFILKEPNFAQGLVAGNEFGREVARMDIRERQAEAMRMLRRLAVGYYFGDPVGTPIRKAIQILDEATRKPRKKKEP